jgi:hypothetical protein
MSDHESADLVPIGPAVVELQRAYPDSTHSSLRFLERTGLLAPTRTPGAAGSRPGANSGDTSKAVALPPS